MSRKGGAWAKPGSAEFQALKRGELNFTGEPSGRIDKGKGHSKQSQNYSPALKNA